MRTLIFSKGRVIQEDNANKKDYNNFRNKTKDDDILVGSVLFTVDGKDLYSIIPYEVSLKGLKRALQKIKEENMSYGNLAKMAEFFYKHYFVEFNYVEFNPRIEGKVDF